MDETLKSILINTQESLLKLASLSAEQSRRISDIEKQFARDAAERVDLHDLVAHLHKRLAALAERVDGLETEVIGVPIGDA